MNIIKTLFVMIMFLSLWLYFSGYRYAIDWEIITTGEYSPTTIWKKTNGLIHHEINGKKLLLTEYYKGSDIRLKHDSYAYYLIISWIGICVFLAASTYFKRIYFFIAVGLLALLINQLNLGDVQIFGLKNQLSLLIPFIGLAGPLIYFHQYKKNAPFLIRVFLLLTISSLLVIGIPDKILFTYHYMAQATFALSVCGIIFLFAIVEEPIYGILKVITNGSGAKDNQLHFILISVAYLANFTLYYLNKTGYFENQFHFFDPFLFLFFTSVIALFTYSKKLDIITISEFSETVFMAILGLGISFLAFLCLSFFQGMDAFYEGFHYFILYFHLGFGFFFFLYVLINFIDPLIKGLPVYKIVYKEQNFPYFSARLGGIAAVLGFFFLSGQEPYELIRSSYYSQLGTKSLYEKEEYLAKSYFNNAAFLGYKAHYPNYMIAKNFENKGKQSTSKAYFKNAASRFPSDYANLNYGNLEKELNPNLAKSTYLEFLRTNNSTEMMNNLGQIHLTNGELESAKSIFDKIKIENKPSWNQAPLINQWYLNNQLNSFTDTYQVDYSLGNYGVKANILAIPNQTIANIDSSMEDLNNAFIIHKRAFLLNGLLHANADSIASYSRSFLETSNDKNYNSILLKSLAINRYKSGEVNDAFLLLKNQVNNSGDFNKGELYDMLGKLALDQGALLLSLEYLNLAIENQFNASRFAKAEVLFGLNQNEKAIRCLQEIVDLNPAYTKDVNQIIDLSKTYHFESPVFETKVLTSFSTDEILVLAHKNSFNVPLILDACIELKKRNSGEEYNLLIESMEINPYSSPLLKTYILTAIEWNLIEYAEKSMKKLESIISKTAFNQFEMTYQAKVEEFSSLENWQ